MENVNLQGWIVTAVLILLVLIFLVMIISSLKRSAVTSAAGTYEGMGWVIFTIILALIIGVAIGSLPLVSTSMAQVWAAAGLTGESRPGALSQDPDPAQSTWDGTKNTLQLEKTPSGDIESVVTFDLGGGRQEIKVFGHSIVTAQTVPPGTVAVTVMLQTPSQRKSSKLVAISKKS